MKNPRIYIVLPVHNRKETTRAFVECLRRQTYKTFHLILVDDGSTDGTSDYVRTVIPDVTILRGNGKLWWAGSLNKAYKYLSSTSASDEDIVYINNDDTYLEPDYFELMISDPLLNGKTLLVSPGHSLHSDFVELGFKAEWRRLRLRQIIEGEEPDALTTRGLYMRFSAYKALGPMHPRLLPHYLSDLEYTLRAKRRGFRLCVSETTRIYVDRDRTGIHRDPSQTLLDFLYNHLISKKTAFNTFYWGNFALLASPPGYKIANFLRVYIRFFRKLKTFLEEPSSAQEVAGACPKP